MNASRRDWSRRLDDAFLAYWTTYMTHIGMSSYLLVYGKAFYYQVELEHKVMWAINKIKMDFNEAAEQRLTGINELDHFLL